MKSPEIIETLRLAQRPAAVEDAEAIFIGYAQDVDLAK
jgi:hypothetical protein